MITPFLHRLNKQGGTLYVFPSVSKDLTKTLVSNDYEFKFSHFACLNLPDIYSGGYSEDSDSNSENDLVKGLYLETFHKDTQSDWTDDGMGKIIAENFQNYIMNFEVAILNGYGDNDAYDDDILTNVSEKVFFNWLEKVGGIKFNDNNTEEEYSRYVDRTVQYLGNIDVTNTVEIAGDSFEEVYLYIPSSVGASTKVYFRTGDQTDNKNYLNTNYEISSEYIIGRKGDDTHPDGLSIEAFYDYDEQNIYTGDEGHTIDFRDSSYGTNGINDMNSLSSVNFEFNAVLIYYDIYAKTKIAGQKKVATNLYGILFLDNIIALHDQYTKKGYLQRYPKLKETLFGNGNSFGLKIDLKIDTVPDNSTYNNIKYIDPNSAYSMVLYEKALSQLQTCIDVFYRQKNEISKLSQKVETLENLIMGIDNIADIRRELNHLKELYEENGVVDTTILTGLIDANSRKIDSIIHGDKDIKLQYDMDVLQPGVGIGMTKTQNKVVINSEPKYYMNTVTDGDNNEITKDEPLDVEARIKNINLSLGVGENLAVVYMQDNGGSCDSDININIKAEEYEWKIGQSLRIYFKFVGDGGFIDFSDEFGININITNAETIKISGSDFDGHDTIELVKISTDENEDEFIYIIK